MIELLLAADQLLAAGDLDRAERIFRQVVEADPRNAIAVVGLARVAEARGMAEEAHELVIRALALDPEEVAALRLVGEPVARIAVPPAAEAAPDESVQGQFIAVAPPAKAAPEYPAPEHPAPEESIARPNPDQAPPVPATPVPAPTKRAPSVIERIRAFLGIGRSAT